MNGSRLNRFALVPALCVALAFPALSWANCACGGGLLPCQCAPAEQGCCCHATQEPAKGGQAHGTCSSSCDCEAAVADDAVVPHKTPDHAGLPPAVEFVVAAPQGISRGQPDDPPPISHNRRQSRLCVWLN